MKILMALPGLHRVNRGAEVAFVEIAARLAASGKFDVVLAGSGEPDSSKPYRFLHTPMTPRERFEKFPKFPPLRSEFRWEELTFAWHLRKTVREEKPDLTVTCSYPFVSWVLRSLRNGQNKKALHIFVTQNGDHPALRTNSEYKLFRCDGLVCTNPIFFQRNLASWDTTLIPNGVDTARFTPPLSPEEKMESRKKIGIPLDGKTVVMASALIPSKNVRPALDAVAALDGVSLVLAGDGPLRDEIDTAAKNLLPGRYLRISLPPEKMPDFYRAGDVFLHMSREESFGNVYIEAASCGTPVVAHDYPTSRWILGDNALLVDTTSTPATSAAILSVLNGEHTFPESFHDEFCECFSWDTIAAHYARFFQVILAKNSL